MKSTSTRKVRAGSGEVQAAEMVDSTPLLTAPGPPAKRRRLVQERLATDGYLLLRGFLDRDEVLAARQAVRDFVRDRHGVDLPANGFDPAWAGVDDAKAESIELLSQVALAHSPPLSTVLESDRLFALFRDYIFGPSPDAPAASADADFAAAPPSVRAFDYKWLRAVPRGKNTGVHIDRVYMGHGTPSLHTAWLPLGDTPVEQGSLVVLPGRMGSHPMYRQLRSSPNSYYDCAVGKDGTHSGYLCDDPGDVAAMLDLHQRTAHRRDVPQWVTSDFRAGDVCILAVDVLHMSSNNMTSQPRISCDTRWIRGSDRCTRFKLSAKHA